MGKPTCEELEKRIKDLQKTEQELYLQKTYFEKLFNSSPEKKPIPLKTSGLVLGTKEGVSYRKKEISINPGERLPRFTGHNLLA